MGLNPLDNDNPHSDNSQTRAKFDWPKLHKAIEFYEREGLCYLPAGWGRKNPAFDSWDEFQSRLPTIAEKGRRANGQ